MIEMIHTLGMSLSRVIISDIAIINWKEGSRALHVSGVHVSLLFSSLLFSSVGSEPSGTGGIK